MQPVAFFDIDGTVFRSSLLIELCENLISADVFPPAMRDEYMDEYTAWKNREGSYEAYIGALVTSYIKHIKGVFYGDLADVGREVVATHSKHVYRYTRDLISALKKQNYYIVAISQSPKTILDEFCKQYGFDKVYGRMYEIGSSDRFTGEMIDIHLIENKATIASRVFSQEGLMKAGSIAVGDTEGDLSLLEAVEKPICFNPNLRLYTVAKREGWPVVVERKDVIYHL